jgi:hypothetical protein
MIKEIRKCTMPMGILFWVLMILWLLFGFWWNGENWRGFAANNVLLFIVIALLGWRVFGAVLQG